MKVILSCTDHPLYSFFIPLAAYSWNKIGIQAICFVPEKQSPAMGLAIETTLMQVNDRTVFPTLDIAPDREVTYFQCARLFGSALVSNPNERIITSDIDMAVFGNSFQAHVDSGFMIFGPDLCPPSQFPICYIMARAEYWWTAFKIHNKYGRKMQPSECLAELLDDIQCENMRGNYWSKDQEHAFNMITRSGIPYATVNRARGNTQFATRRIDRDGWDPDPGAIDAHLLRPGHDADNFESIKALFHAMYPTDDLTWMVEYRGKFMSLI